MTRFFHHALAALACAAASISMAQTATTFYACVTSKGDITVVSQTATCGKDQKIQWNQVGPEGPAGPQGPTGPQGIQGTTGQGFLFDNSWEVPVPPGNPSAWRTFTLAGEVGKVYLVTFGTTFENYDTAASCNAQVVSGGDGVPFSPAIATVPAKFGDFYGYASVATSFALQGDGLARTATIYFATSCTDVRARFPYVIVTVLNQ